MTTTNHLAWFLDGGKSIAVASAVYGALETGLLASLLDGPATLEVHCERAGVAPRVARRVLELLELTGLVERTEQGFLAGASLAQWARGALGGFATEAGMWTALPAAIRAGGPVGPPRVADDVYRVVAPRLASLGEGPARALAERLRLAARAGAPRRVLDVGCGSGVYGLAIAEVSDDVEVTGLDFPGPLEGFAARAAQLGLERRIHRVPGDAATTDVSGPFDVVMIANVLRVLDRETRRTVLDRALGWTARGGVLVVVDALAPPTDEARAWTHALYALHLSLRSRDGDVPDPAWLVEVGATRGFRLEDRLDLAGDGGIQGAVVLRAPG